MWPCVGGEEGGWERQGDTEDGKKGSTVKNARDKDLI